MKTMACLVLLAGAVLAGCAGETRSPASPTTNGEQVAESPYHNVRPLEEYFHLLTPPLRADLETTGIPRNPPSLPRELATEQGYLAAVRKARAEGLDALSEDERLVVLFVSAAALAAQEETIRYLLVTVDPVSGEEMGRLVAEERYRFDMYEGYTLPNLSQRRTVAQGMAWDFGTIPHLAADAPDEVIESYEFASAGTDKEKVTRIRCERTGQTWVQREGDYTEQYGLVWPDHTLPNVDFFSVRAEPRGVEVVGGRPAWLLSEVEDFGPSKGTERRYWLDRETLWPLQWEFASGGDIIRGTVEEVNGKVDIPSLNAGGSCGE